MSMDSSANQPQVDMLRSTQRTGLATLDGHSVSVVLQTEPAPLVFRGKAAFQRDDACGNVLVITPEEPQPGDPQLTILERDWHGRVIVDTEHGCEFCMLPERE